MEPLWEVGLFNFVSDIPQYRGSDESKTYAFPLPYLVYRGKHLRATREGVRGIFYQDDRFETSISLFGNPPVDKDNEARNGMEDLDALGEMGPSVKWFFLGRGPADKLYLQLSLRAAASVGFESGVQMRYQGLTGGLDTVYYNQSLFRDQGIKFRLMAGLNFADRDYNGYFYDVNSAYATAVRPTYESDGGYGGFSVSASMQYKLNPYVSLGFYSRWDNLDGAVFEDSSLVRRNNNYVIGSALILRLARSKTLVPSEEFD